EDVALGLGEIGVVVAEVERKCLVGEAYADVPGPVALVRHAIGKSSTADRLPGTIHCSDRTVEIIAGAEWPIAGIAEDEHADSAGKHGAGYGVGDVAGGEPAVCARIQD